MQIRFGTFHESIATFAGELVNMITRYNNISLALGIPGIALQIGGRVWSMQLAPAVSLPAMLVMLLGTGLLIAGLAFYAKAKGRNPAWGLMGLLSIIGLIVLACLPDLEKKRVLPRFGPKA